MNKLTVTITSLILLAVVQGVAAKQEKKEEKKKAKSAAVQTSGGHPQRATRQAEHAAKAGEKAAQKSAKQEVKSARQEAKFNAKKDRQALKQANGFSANGNKIRNREVARSWRRSWQSGVWRANQGFATAYQRRLRDRHDGGWWRSHYTTLALVAGGWYYLDSGWWYPAWGYNNSYVYPYDGPIYAYNSYPPDRVTSEVQRALSSQGYYDGPVDGLMGAGTRAALSQFQADHGLVITSAIDQQTLGSLGLA